jgi:hypothetical protein
MADSLDGTLASELAELRDEIAEAPFLARRVQRQALRPHWQEWLDDLADRWRTTLPAGYLPPVRRAVSNRLQFTEAAEEMLRSLHALFPRLAGGRGAKQSAGAGSHSTKRMPSTKSMTASVENTSPESDTPTW